MILTPLLGLRAVALALRGDGLVDSKLPVTGLSVPYWMMLTPQNGLVDSKLPGAGLNNALMEQVNNPVESSTPSAAVELKRMNMPATLAVCSSGWLIPGLGHVLIGRWVRGAIFAACVLLMFVLGLGMRGKLYDLEFDEPLHVFAFIANIGTGIPYWVAERLNLGLGTMTWPSYDYGTTYLWVCGLLNYLIVLDAFDIAQGRKP